MTAERDISVTMPLSFLGQMCDGIRVLIEQWQATARYIEEGTVDDEVCIRECDDADEANAIARHYSEILARLESKLLEHLKASEA